MSGQKIIRLGIADRQKFVHDSIELMSLNSDSFFKVNLKAYSVEELHQKLAETKIDILVADINFPLEIGKEICKKIKIEHPSIKILVFSHYDDKEIISDLYHSFASSYVEKTESLETLKLSLQEIVKNGFHYRYDLSKIFEKGDKKDNTKKVQQAKSFMLPTFSKQDVEIVRLAQLEQTTQQIATRLNLSVKTIEKHRSKIMTLTNSKKMVGVINYFIEHGIL